MSDITLSILGMYNQDNEILDDQHLYLPEGVDRATIIPLILSETAELEVLYPRPDTMKTVVKAWSFARLSAWERMLDALEEEYNPLHNYDRTEVETGTNTGSEGESGTIQTAEDISDTGSNQTSATTTDQVTGYNSNTFADDNKQLASGNASSTNARDRDETETRNLTHTRNLAHARNLHIFGNIGVTTSAQMLTGELEVRATDIYRIIVDEFKQYFCLMIY